MYTIVVRKADGSLVEVSHEDTLSFTINQQTGTVDVWIFRQFLHIAYIVGSEAWVKGVVTAVDDDYTGYYMSIENEKMYAVANSFACVDGRTRFNSVQLGETMAGKVWHTHTEWLAAGFTPVKRLD